MNVLIFIEKWKNSKKRWPWCKFFFGRRRGQCRNNFISVNQWGLSQEMLCLLLLLWDRFLISPLLSFFHNSSRGFLSFKHERSVGFVVRHTTVGIPDEPSSSDKTRQSSNPLWVAGPSFLRWVKWNMSQVIILRRHS